MNDKDIRWVQRLNNYCAALDNLKEIVEIAAERDLTKWEKQGMIKAFEYTHELAWKTLKDFYKSTGDTGIHGSIDAFNLAFERELLTDDTLFKSVESRNDTVHVYNEETADEIYHAIVDEYYDAFEQLREALLKEKDNRGL